MTHPEPFGDERDARLAMALRDHYDGAGHAAFVAQVMGQLESRVDVWAELARWARPGVAAAVILMAALGFWEVVQAATNPAPTASAEVAGLEPLDRDGLIGIALSPGR